MAVVYLHRKKNDNSIFYVGIGLSKNRANYFRDRNPHWTNVFNKYGVQVDLIAEDITIDEARELEMLIIETIGVDNLTNITLGGEGAFGLKHSDESKKKIGLKSKGRRHTDESKQKISKALKGHINYLKSHTKEAKEKIRLASLNRKHSKESIDKMRKVKENTKPSKDCYVKGVKTRKQNSINVKELVSGLEFKMAYSSDFTEVPKRLIYSNSKHDRPIRSGKYKGMNFITI